MKKAAMTVTTCLLLASTAMAQQRALLEVTADVGVTSVRDKTMQSNGLGPTSPLRQNQNWGGFENKDLLMAFDTKSVQGWQLEKAWLHVYLAKGDLFGVGLTTVLAAFDEGQGINLLNVAGGASWDYAKNPVAADQPRPRVRRGAAPAAAAEGGLEWAWPGSKLFSVSWSHPAARFSNAGYGEIERELVGMKDLKLPSTQPGAANPNLSTKIEPANIQRDQTPGNRYLHLRIPVEPRLVESLAAGVAYGLAMTDDKGQVAESYSLIGPAYPYYDNDAEDIWVYTRNISEPILRPRLEVVGRPAPEAKPDKISNLKVVGVSPSESTVFLEFHAGPGVIIDNGGMRVPFVELLAYDASYSDSAITSANFDQAKPLPRWAIPKPRIAGGIQRFPIFTLPPGKYHIGIRSVSRSGVRGEVADVEITIPAVPDSALAKGATWKAPGAAAALPKDKVTVSVVDDSVRVDPVSGGVMADGTEYAKNDAYFAENPVWQDKAGRVSLQGLANEVLAFQLIVKKGADDAADVKVQASDLAGPERKQIAGANVQFYRLWYVSAGGGPRSRGSADTWVPEVCIPLKEPFGDSFGIPAADNKVPGQTNQAVWVDVYIPRGTDAGVYSGSVTVTAAGLKDPISIPVSVNVLPLSLPDANSWVVDINRYNSPTGFTGVDMTKPDEARQALHGLYALNHQHRLILNVLPYTHSSRMDMEYLPKMQIDGAKAAVADWTDWDGRFGPLLDGSAFSPEKGYVGPGANTPLSQMYLAFHEGWPLPVKGFYEDYKDVTERVGFAEYAKTARRIEEAFKSEYKQGNIECIRQFIEHFGQKGWTKTNFQFFYNNKYYWKCAYFGGMGVGGSSFWLGDECSDFDDYDYNRFLWTLGIKGYAAAKAPQVKIHTRVDISQPAMTRTLWDNVGNLWSVGGLAPFAATADVRRKFIPTEEYWQYGGGAGPESAPVAMMQQFTAVWAMGTVGILPYWTTFDGTGGAWKTANAMAIHYSGRNWGGTGKNYVGALASLRMKIMRRCQQDMEYMHLLSQVAGWDRPRVRRAVAALADDPTAPVLSFAKLTAAQWLQLRQDLLATILAGKK